MEPYEAEVSEQFITGMRNRMYVSYYKYGAAKDAYPHKADAIASLLIRLIEYAKTGNTEYMIDAANFCMIEFMYPSHEAAHFTPTDSDGSPGRIEIGNPVPVHYPNRDLLPTEKKDG